MNRPAREAITVAVAIGLVWFTCQPLADLLQPLYRYVVGSTLYDWRSWEALWTAGALVLVGLALIKAVYDLLMGRRGWPVKRRPGLCPRGYALVVLVPHRPQRGRRSER